MKLVGFSPAAIRPAPLQETAKAASAAKDFEALLIAQMLQSFREQGSGWLGGGDDEASATAFGLGEQYLAGAMAAGGGFGLGRIIERSLDQTAASARTQTAAVPGQAPPSRARQR